MAEPWQTAGASVPGPGRARNADAHAVFRCRDGNGQRVTGLCLADGAGSARKGREGARLAVATFKACVMANAPNEVNLGPSHMRDWLHATRQAVCDAPRAGETVRDHASTFLAVVLGNKVTLYAQIGDGAIAACEEGRWQPTLWPERGRYASETRFLAETPTATILEHNRSPDAVCLFSDGFEPLALVEQERQVAGGLLSHIRTGLSGHLTQRDRNAALSVMLKSAAVQSRLSDDCTLLFASRALCPVV